MRRGDSGLGGEKHVFKRILHSTASTNHNLKRTISSDVRDLISRFKMPMRIAGYRPQRECAVSDIGLCVKGQKEARKSILANIRADRRR